MKLIMSKKFLTAAIKAVLPAVPGRPGLPILTGIRLDATTERLTLQTTDLEVPSLALSATEYGWSVRGRSWHPPRRWRKPSPQCPGRT